MPKLNIYVLWAKIRFRFSTKWSNKIKHFKTAPANWVGNFVVFSDILSHPSSLLFLPGFSQNLLFYPAVILLKYFLVNFPYCQYLKNKQKQTGKMTDNARVKTATTMQFFCMNDSDY